MGPAAADCSQVAAVYGIAVTGPLQWLVVPGTTGTPSRPPQIKEMTMIHRRVAFALALATCGLTAPYVSRAADAKVVRYARFRIGNTAAYGIVENDQIRQIDGDLFGSWKATDRTYPLASVKLLVPVARPSQVLALAGSYKSHLGGGNHVTTIVTTTKVTTNATSGETTTDSKTTVETEKPGEVPLKFQTPQVFFKSPSCLIANGENIVIPPGTNEVHYEAELVIVMGRKAKNVGQDEARSCILGVTCGNDVSARDWQKNDVQWWRAKGSDTFGPVGPFIVSGINYDDLLMKLRLNGKVLQEERTSQLIHNVAATVSHISRHVTLEPGDLIFTGTPGKTSAIKPGDKVEVEIEGIGTLANPVVASAGGG
jgi:2-keto-4-pentenoate hydratase/2-oxohepta-3-ene-1,7-dioic acid hydratase in catechol pathway